MSAWGRNDQAVTANSTTTNESTTGAPIQTAFSVKGGKTGTVTSMGAPNSQFGNTSPGSAANVDSLMFNSDKPGLFVNGLAVGVFGVTAPQMKTNINNQSHDRPAHAGWVLRRAGTGPVVSAVLTGGNNYVNGETITVSNATVNAQLTVVSSNGLPTNASAVTLTVNVGGYGFTNVGMTAYSFDREKYITAVTVTGTPLSYSNNSILVMSNGSINAIATMSTNSTGGFSAVTVTQSGLFPNSFTTVSNLTLTVANAGGGAVQGNSSTACFTGVTFANSSTGGTVTLTLGGRAGRTMTETLVALGSLGAQSAGYGTPASQGGYYAANGSSVGNPYYPANTAY